MDQGSDETITQFTTRLQGQANICDLTVECPGCVQSVSFREKLIMYQFIRGLHDNNAQERILEASAGVKGGELLLIRVPKLAEAYEMGKENQKSVNHGGQLSRISEYQASKRSSRQESRAQSTNKKDNTQKCGNCGRSDHLSKLNDRRKNCPAFDQNCTKCQTKWAFCQTVFTSELRQDNHFVKGYSKLSAIHNNAKVKRIRHHIVDSFGSWKPSDVQPHGKITL